MEQLLDISGNTTFDKILQIDIPQFKIYNHSFSNFLVNDYKNHLNLTKMAETAKQEGVIFQHLSEPLLEGEISVKSAWPDLNGMLGLTATSMAGLTFLYCIWSFFKIRKLATALLVLERTAQVRSATLPPFVYKVETTTSNANFLNMSFFQELTLSHILFAIIGILVSTIVIIIIYRSRQSNHFTYLLMELTTGSSCSVVTLAKLPLCPSYWTFNVPPSIQKLEVLETFKPKLYITWENFTVTNKLTSKSIEVKTIVKLSLFHAIKLKEITSHPYCAHLLISHQGHYKELAI